MEQIISSSNTHQQGLNEVVINKVRRMIDGKQPGVQAAMERLYNEGKIAQDFIAPIGANLKRNEHTPVITFDGAGENVLMNMPDGQFGLHDNAIGQLADRMGVPQRYLRALASGSEWQRLLAAQILNEHSGWTERSRVLIRTVGHQVRGVLSDSYRRLNSVEILTAFVQEASRQGAVVADAYMNDTKVWAETILPEPLVVPTAKNGDVVIFAGARFSTSDYGDGIPASTLSELRRGEAVYVCGRLRAIRYTGASGDKVAYEVLAHRLTRLGGSDIPPAESDD